MVDYSKWNNIELSDSDDDDSGLKPKVTQLSNGERIQIGPNGSTIISDKGQPLNQPKVSKLKCNVENGSYCNNFNWSQNRYEVNIQSIVPYSTKASDVKLKVNEKQLEVFLHEALHFGGELAYTIDIDNTDTIYGGISWEVTDYTSENRLLALTLTKKSPIPGSFIWWKHVFITDPEIDLNSIKGRSGNISASNEWELAHKMFKEKISARDQIVIDDNDG
jgi:hypothetical protein